MRKVNPVNSYNEKIESLSENNAEISLQLVFYGPYALSINIPTAG